jgi:hypothetical protein
MSTRILFIASIAAALLSGCATNPYTTFYRDNTKAWPSRAVERLSPPYTGEPRIITTSNHRSDSDRLLADNYAPIGFASFNGRLGTIQEVREQARRVGAEVVICIADFSHTEEGVAAVPMFQPGGVATTSTTGSFNANSYPGSGGLYGNYNGTTTTKLPDTFSTTYVPYSRPVYSQAAEFWRKQKQGVLGAIFTPLPDETRKTLNRNTGAYVRIVVNESPAFRANILQGDIITHIGNEPSDTVEDLIAMLQRLAGQKVLVRVLRDGQPKEVEIRLNPPN